MTIVRELIPDIFLELLANLEETVYSNFKTYPSVIPKLFRVRQTDLDFVNVTSVSDLPLFVERGEAEPATPLTPAQEYDKKFTLLLYSAMLKFGKLSAKKSELVEEMGHSCARSAFFTKEINHVNIFNRATNSSYTGPDGKTLAADDHPLSLGGTDDNKMAAAAFGITSFENACDMLAKLKSGAGNYINTPPAVVFGGLKLRWSFQQVLNSTQLPGSANNDLNPVKRVLGEVEPVVSVHITDDLVWGVLADPRDNGLRSYEREALNSEHYPDPDTGGVKSRWDYMDACSWISHRGIVWVPSS